MIPVSLPVDLSETRQFAVWLITIMIVAFGFRYARETIAFVLDKLYEIFIEKNPAGI
jgi:hypothetical protein